jgi:hypothetical protein
MKKGKPLIEVLDLESPEVIEDSKQLFKALDDFALKHMEKELSLMLPVKTLSKLSRISSQENKTINEIIVEMVDKYE